MYLCLVLFYCSICDKCCFFGMLEVTVTVIHSIHLINNSLIIEYCIHDIWGWQHYISLFSPFAFSDAEISLPLNNPQL